MAALSVQASFGTGAQAAQQAVGLSATVPAYCRIGAHATAIDIPIVISVNAGGEASAAPIHLPGVICNAPAKLVATLRPGYQARISFGGAVATVATGAAHSASSTTAQAAKGALTVVITPASVPGTAAANYTATLHIALVVQ
jgi:hypothetical protein